jgi:heterotetrameric sarcosine oxidase gamma subunit
MRYDVKIADAPLQAVFDLRGHDRAALRRCLTSAGLRPPASANAILREADGTEVLSVGPRRFLVMAPRGRESDIDASLTAVAAKEESVTAANISDAFAGILLTGAGAAEVLAQATPLDIEPRVFPADAATFTDLFAVAALVRRHPGGFALWTDASLKQHIVDGLSAAAGQTSQRKKGA